MKWTSVGLLVLSVWCAVCTCFVGADESPRASARNSAAPNAAVIYWQAFAAIPNLKEDEKKLLEAATASATSALSDELKPIVAQFRVALHEMHRARAIQPCDWQLDVEAGPELRLTHLQKARDLSRVALLRARLRFAAGESDAALTDVLAVLKMARDCGSSPILISLLVDVALEKSATDVLAAHLAQLNREQLDRLAVALRELPVTSDVAAVVRWEKKLFGDWLERKIDAEAAKLGDPMAGGALLIALAASMGLEADFKPQPDDTDGQRKAVLLKSLTVADVRGSLKQLQSDYAELETIAGLNLAERAVRGDEFEKSLSIARKGKTRDAALRYFSASLLSNVKSVLAREEQLLTRRALLEQAVRIQASGAGDLPTILGKKIEYHKSAVGFELRCPCGAEVEVITVGPRP